MSEIHAPNESPVTRRLTDVWTCPGCDARWRGQQPCHCSGCHQTLSGIGLFDKHRSHGTCKTPQEAGATRLVDGVWRGPEFDGGRLFREAS